VWRAGQVRALCVFDKERIEYKTKVAGDMSWNDVADVQGGRPRRAITSCCAAMFLPAKSRADQTAFYVDLFKKVAQTSEFKDYLEKQALKSIFLTGPDMVKFLEEDNALNAQLMNEAGFRREMTLPDSPDNNSALTCLSCGLEIWMAEESDPAEGDASAVVGTRSADIVVYLMLLAVAALFGFDNWRTGIVLGSRRPAGRLLPVLSVSPSRRREPLRTSPQAPHEARHIETEHCMNTQKSKWARKLHHAAELFTGHKVSADPRSMRSLWTSP